MRWSQGVWSERRLLEAVNTTESFFAIPYGPSGVAPTDDVKAFELYFERLEKAGLGRLKRPDLLVFKISDKSFISNFLNELGGSEELPFIREHELQPLLSKAVIAVECETSLWVAGKMPHYGKDMRKQKRLDGKLGFAKNAVLPTVIIKDEDIEPLRNWQIENRVPIHIWHVFLIKLTGYHSMKQNG
jgi:hypothetical protein